MASRALRVMAFAMEPEAGEIKEQELVFLGLAGMEDPVRPGVRESVEKFRKAGVRTVMITGDYPDTALAIARAPPHSRGRRAVYDRRESGEVFGPGIKKAGGGNCGLCPGVSGT